MANFDAKRINSQYIKISLIMKKKKKKRPKLKYTLPLNEIFFFFFFVNSTVTCLSTVANTNELIICT